MNTEELVVGHIGEVRNLGNLYLLRHHSVADNFQKRVVGAWGVGASELNLKLYTYAHSLHVSGYEVYCYVLALFDSRAGGIVKLFEGKPPSLAYCF